MIRYLAPICVLAALLWSTPGIAEIRTFLEPRLVEEMETVRLTLRVVGTSQVEPPDLSALDQDFEVLGNQTSSRISSINGRTSSMVEYQITLRPKRTGEIVLPQIQIGNELSEPVRLNVRPLDPSVKQTIESMVFFETELSADSVYVQAEAVLTRRLFYSNGVQIYSDLPGAPEIPDAVVLQLGETQSLSILRGATRYGVIEQRFAVFPEVSGPLEIPSIAITSSVRLQTGGRVRRSGIRVSTDAVLLNVLPIPDSYPADQPWLPARNVTVESHWQPEAESFHVGDAISYQLDLIATGNTGSSIPPLAIPLPDAHFKVYPEAPSMEEKTLGNHIVGYRTESYALIPTRPGELAIPSVKVTWWDTQQDELRIAYSEPRQISITGNAPIEAPDQDPEPAQPASGNNAEQPDTLTRQRVIEIGLIGLAVLSAVLALLLGARMACKKITHAPQKTQRPADIRRKFREFRRACHSEQPAQIRDALSAYLASYYGCSPAAGIAELRHRKLAAAPLTALDQALYRKSAAVDSTQTARFDAQDLLAAVEATTSAVKARTGKNKSDKLPPLFA